VGQPSSDVRAHRADRQQQYILTPDQETATAVYSGWFPVIAIFFNLMWRYAAADGRLLSDHDRHADLAGVITRRYRWGPITYFAAFALAFIWAPASLALNLALAIYYALPRERAVSLPGRRA
jgi:fatty acid desaturase